MNATMYPLVDLSSVIVKLARKTRGNLYGTADNLQRVEKRSEQE
jgi:hypothetical protein